MNATADPSKRKRGRPSEAELRERAGFADAKPDEARGGARVGAGRKSAALEAGAADAHVMKAKAQAKKEVFLAQMAELDYRKASGEYVPRDEVRQAAATAFSAIAQTLRSIPDNIERKLGIAPEIAEEIGVMIDEAMNELSVELERMSEAVQ